MYAFGMRNARVMCTFGIALACLRHLHSQLCTFISTPGRLHQSAQVQADQRIAMRHGSVQGLSGPPFLSGAEILWSGEPGNVSRHCGVTLPALPVVDLLP